MNVWKVTYSPTHVNMGNSRDADEISRILNGIEIYKNKYKVAKSV